MTSVYFGLGSNIEPETHLPLGVRELASRYADLRVSSVYKSAAVGFDGPEFLNLVVNVQTDASPLTIIDAIEEIHGLAGRVRGKNKNLSRTLDVDLLLYGNLVSPQRPLRLPRSDVLEYSFVLRPLAELAPLLVHPLSGRTMAEHWAEFDRASHPLQRVDDIL